MQTSFKKRLVDKEQMIGTLLTLPSPEIAELLSKAGFDWLFIDMEHSSITLKDAQSMIQAASPNAHCVVRVPGNDEIWLKRVLDIGPAGIIIPQVNTMEQAQYAVKFSKYPPVGKRSAGISRAHGYGLDFARYIEEANDDTAVIVQCEHKESIKNLPEIIGVEGIDCIFVGPYDLSGSYNKLGKVDDTEIINAIETIQKTCVEAGMPLGIFGGKPEAVLPYSKTGFNLIAMGLDVLMLSQSAQYNLKKLKG
jgi:2-dehydro-3-deoxyglucarate aldolase/4-hydroxy-2-oxoheptanedioate aldolase